MLDPNWTIATSIAAGAGYEPCSQVAQQNLEKHLLQVSALSRHNCKARNLRNRDSLRDRIHPRRKP